MSALPFVEVAASQAAPDDAIDGVLFAPATTGPALAAPGRLPASRPSTLRVVRPRNAPPRAPFVLLVSALLAAGLIGVLLVNTKLAQGSFTVDQLQRQQSTYADQVQALSQSVADQGTPQSLAARAIALGMVAAPNPVFKKSDGAVLGAATKAVRPPPPPAPKLSQPSQSSQPSPTPQASASVSPSASPSASVSPSASTSATASASTKPTATPTGKPTATPTGKPTGKPSANPTPTATTKPPTKPSPTAGPTAKPTGPKPTPTGGHA